MPEKLYLYFARERDRLDMALRKASSPGRENEMALLRTLKSITMDQIRLWSETLGDREDSDRRIAA